MEIEKPREVCLIRYIDLFDFRYMIICTYEHMHCILLDVVSYLTKPAVEEGLNKLFVFGYRLDSSPTSVSMILKCKLLFGFQLSCPSECSKSELFTPFYGADE